MPLIICPECSGEISSKAIACPKCGCPQPGGGVGASGNDNISWNAVGKIAVIRCPVSKQKEEHEGDWIYESGIMSRRVLFKKQVIDLRQQLIKVELAPEVITTLAGYKKAGELTPGMCMALLTNVFIAEAYQERERRRILSESVLAEIHLKFGWFYAYTSGEIYVELLKHTSPARGTH